MHIQDIGTLAYILMCWSGISAGLLVIAILLRQKTGIARKANAYLSVLVVILMLTLIYRIVYLSDWTDNFPSLYLVVPPLILAMGPCLLFYTRGLIKPQEHSPGDAYHWVLPLSSMASVIGYFMFIGLSGLHPEYDLSQQRSPWGPVFWLFNLPTVIVLPLYALACLRLLQQHRSAALNCFSNLEGVRLQWLSTLATLLVIAGISGYILPPEGLPRVFWFAPWAVLLIYYIGYMGILQPAILGQEVEIDTPSANEQIAPCAEKGSRSEGRHSQLPGNSEALWEQLEQIMSREKPYLQPNLTLGKLSELVDLHPNHLSAVINHHAKTSFFEYINHHRVEVAKEMLVDPQCKMSILDIAMESGFNSKTAFYRQFKQFTGKTPSQLRTE